MTKRSTSSMALAILTFYLIPVLTLSLLSASEISWKVFSVGLGISMGGSLALFLLILAWEKAQTPLEALQKLEQSIKIEKELQQLLDDKQQQIENISEDNEHYKKQLKASQLELTTYQRTTEMQLQAKEQQLRESQLLVIEHQQHILNLESKERELHNELQSLLQLTQQVEKQKPTELPKRTLPPPSDSGSDVRQRLKRYIDTATKMTGPHYQIQTSLIQNASADYYALDLRRLFDILQEESHAIALLYSQKDGRLLFANQTVKHWLGWSPEKFVQDFPEAIQDGFEDWKQIINQLSIASEGQANVSLQTKSGEVLPLKCYLGAIHTGLFRTHAIALLVRDGNHT